MRSMPDLVSQVSLPPVSRPGDSVPPSQGTLVDTMTVQLSTHAAHGSSGHTSSLPPPPSGDYGLAHGTPYGTETFAPAVKPKKSGAGLVIARFGSQQVAVDDQAETLLMAAFEALADKYLRLPV